MLHILTNQINYSRRQQTVHSSCKKCKKKERKEIWLLLLAFSRTRRSELSKRSWIKFVITIPRNYCIMHGNENSFESLANRHVTHNFVSFNIALAFYDTKWKTWKFIVQETFSSTFTRAFSKVLHDVNLCYTQDRSRHRRSHQVRRGKSTNYGYKNKLLSTEWSIGEGVR